MTVAQPAMPSPGPSYLRELDLRPGDSRRVGMTAPQTITDGWWVSLLWCEQNGSVISFADLGPARYKAYRDNEVADMLLVESPQSVANRLESVCWDTGAGKLYTLTVMTPNEGFAELIRGGEPVELDADDIRILQGA